MRSLINTATCKMMGEVLCESACCVFLILTVQVPYYCFVSGAEQQLCKSCKKEQYGSVFIAVLSIYSAIKQAFYC